LASNRHAKPGYLGQVFWTATSALRHWPEPISQVFARRRAAFTGTHNDGTGERHPRRADRPRVFNQLREPACVGYGITWIRPASRWPVIEDSSPDARQLAIVSLARLTYPSRRGGARRNGEGARRCEIRGLVVIPSDFTARLDRSDEVRHCRCSRRAEPNIAAFVEIIRAASGLHWLDQRARTSGQAVPKRSTWKRGVWFNPSAESRNYLIPGSITLIMTVVALC